MNQAILNLIEEIEKEVEFEEYEADVSSWYFYAISKIKEKLSSFSSQWIDKIQRYDSFEYKHWVKSDTWEYVKYSDLVDLLRN